METSEREALEQIVEKADNLLGAATWSVAPEVHVEGLTGGLREIRKVALGVLPADSEVHRAAPDPEADDD